jgi:AraC family ethanolamine operon transcriptional activator
MDRSIKPSPLRRIRRYIRDFEHFSMLFPSWDGSFTQMSRGRFQGHVQVAEGRHLRAFNATTNQSILTRGYGDPTSVAFIPITSRNEQTIWRGKSIARGGLIVKGAEAGYNNQTARHTQIRSLIVRAEVVQYALRILAEDRAHQDLTTWQAVRPSPDAMAQFEVCLSALLATVREGSEAGSVQDRLERECLRMLVEMLVSQDDAKIVISRSDARSRLVSRVSSFMRERLMTPLSAFDLCSEFGVSDRLLRLAFRETHGMGPIAYFRLMRLHAVRKSLIAARGGRDTSVAEVLQIFSVKRPSGFAREYMRHFGEMPSVTLGVRGWSGVQAMTRDRAIANFG